MKRIAVIGDSILDIYSFYKYLKDSPEADVPVIKLKNKIMSMGGAGLLAEKICSLGNIVDFYTSFIDKDHLITSLNLNSTIYNFKNISNSLTIKNRIIYEKEYVFRVDEDDLIEHSNKSISEVLEKFKLNIESYDAAIFSDYNKGFLNKALVSEMLRLCKDKEVLTFLDPKPENNLISLGWDFIKPNIKEGVKITSEHKVKKILEKIYEISNSNIFMTSGKEGSYFFDGKKIYYEKTYEKNPIDVSGCGDIAMATFVHNILNGKPIEENLKISMKEASRNIDKFGNPF